MLTGKQVRVWVARQRVVPSYIDPGDSGWLEVAKRLLAIFRAHEGRTRGELEEELRDFFGTDPRQIVHQGLAKLLEDRCEFAVSAPQPPEKLRERVFLAAAETRLRRGRPGPAVAASPPPFPRQDVLDQVAGELQLSPRQIEEGLFADLRSEQRLVKFRDVSAERLLARYNVALAQAVLLRSTRVHVVVRDEPPQRYRQILRQVKFHRLICEVEKLPDGIALHLDGPLSLFSATQKYGLQLALFLPAVLPCRNFELTAELAWGPQRKPRLFTLGPADGLVSPAPDRGMYVPPELDMFAQLFRKKVADWDIAESADIFPLGDRFWVPDYYLTHRASGQGVYLEVLGFWRKASVEKHLERLRRHAPRPFVLAVSEQLHIDDADLAGLPAEIHRFRQMPLPEEVARLAERVLNQVDG
jgi:hypothetical protein